MHWATLIALHDGEGVVAGVAHQPYVGETFAASAGGRAEWRRGSERRTLRTRRCPTVGDAAVACTDPRMFRTAGERAAFDRVAEGSRLTRWGGDCYAYCLLAMGLIDIVIEASLHAYDVQALMPIVEAAGGTMTTWDGGRCDEGGSVVACGDGRCIRGSWSCWRPVRLTAEDGGVSYDERRPAAPGRCRRNAARPTPVSPPLRGPRRVTFRPVPAIL